jgi:hypothetical protein
MYSDNEFTKHMILDHDIFTKGESYWPQLPEDVHYDPAMR